MQLRSFLCVAWTALAAAQVLPSTYNLSSVLSTQATLTTFTSYLNLFPALVSQVEPGNVTVLAPSNEAFSKYFDSNNATSIATDKLAAILSYHVLQGAFTRLLFNNTPLFIPTLLSDPTYANVTGGQRVEIGLLGGEIVFYSAVKAISKLTTADILYSGGENGVIHIIDSLLIPPIDEPTTVTQAKLNGFIAILVETPQDPHIIGVVGPSSDWTLFAPNSTKFDAKTAPLEAVYAYEDYHFIHGEVAYSPLLTNGKKLRTVQGGEVTITVLNGSTYVNDIKIIDPDYLISTGVIHLIESNLNSNDTSARPSTKTSSPSTSTSSSLPTSTPTHAPTSSSSLSSGAKVGIGVGAAAAFLVLIGLAWYCMRRRRASLPSHNTVPSELPPGERSLAAELPHNEKKDVKRGAGASELDGEQQMYELGTDR